MARDMNYIKREDEGSGGWFHLWAKTLGTEGFL
jgi:hypothetical protein